MSRLILSRRMSTPPSESDLALGCQWAHAIPVRCLSLEASYRQSFCKMGGPFVGPQAIHNLESFCGAQLLLSMFA